tara:strand:- start:176 stop:313 length:138 start_codon:yes stop_codon:yes gene_type:complete
MRKGFGTKEVIKPTKKKTRQGHGKRTKYGNKLSKKYYKKRKRGQG